MTVTIDVAPKLPSDTGDGNNSKTCAHRESYPAESETRGGLHGTFSSQPSDALLSQTAVTQDLISGITAVDNARTCTRGRQKNEDKSYKSRGFGNGGKSNRQKGSKGLRDGDNSSSNGGNSGADGNGEDNDGSDDDDDDEYLEDEEEEEEEEEDDEEEESKNEEEEAEESGCSSKAEKNSNGVDVGIKKESDNSRQRACRQRTKQEEVCIPCKLHTCKNRGSARYTVSRWGGLSNLSQFVGIRSSAVNSIVSGHPRELKKVSVSGTVHLRELFP